MTEWATIRIEAQLLNELMEHREKTGMPASTVVKIAVRQYLDEQTQAIPYWLRQLEKNANLVNQLRKILKLKEDT